MKKMNNKGFSLVELIVVVLIMAIIAVALAPQVMKWVENSRKSNDIENYNALVEAANVAGTNEKVLAQLNGNSATISMSSSGTTITVPSGTALQSAIALTLPDYATTKIQGQWNSGSAPFQINVAVSAGTVKVTKVDGKFPQKNFE